MKKLLRGWWLAVSTPSLVRRLVVAQMATLAVVWTVFLVAVIYDVMQLDRPRRQQAVQQMAETLLATAQDLLDRPEALQRFLVHMDRVWSDESGEPNSPLRVTTTLRVDGQVVYVTPGLPGVLPTKEVGTLEYLEQGGMRWATYTQRSADGRLAVTFHRLGDLAAAGVWTASSGILALPMLLSVPFLVVAGWLSVRLALRPWSAFSAEVGSRSPQDLSPLVGRSRHRELVGIADAVNGLLARVRDGLARERSFVADAAHELRTPLAAMRINVEALQQHPGGPRQGELLDGLVAGTARASRLVSQLLSLTRSDVAREAGALVELDLDRLVQERLAALAPIADAADVELELAASGGTHVLGDAEALSSLVDNLVQNAIKYSPAGHRVRVATRIVPGGAELVVEDEGPGIPAELYDRVFDRFYRMPDQAQPGSGLGLAIVKAVAVRHRAHIDLGVAEGGRGLRIVVSFTRE